MDELSRISKAVKIIYYSKSKKLLTVSFDPGSNVTSNDPLNII